MFCAAQMQKEKTMRPALQPPDGCRGRKNVFSLAHSNCSYTAMPPGANFLAQNERKAG